MPELSDKSGQKVVFPKNGQAHFLLQIKAKMGMGDAELAVIAGVHRRTFNDWVRGKYLMPWLVAKTLSSRSNVTLPGDIQVRDRYWYTSLGGKPGWLAVKKKYGRVPVDEEYRLKKWREWWEREGQYRPNNVVGIRKPIRKPCLSVKLAEFTGIVMGDGSITKRQVRVTLHVKDDFCYAKHVKQLVEQLFSVPVAMYSGQSYGSIVELSVSRTELVEFCTEKLGLSVGNKLQQGLDVPKWIMNNSNYQKSCLRGLVDTDGCVFYERHRIKGKSYSYPRLNFTSASTSLCDSVFTMLQALGVSPRKRNKQGFYRCVQLEKKDDIKHYFEVVGTNNPKHERRLTEG